MGPNEHLWGGLKEAFPTPLLTKVNTHSGVIVDTQHASLLPTCCELVCSVTNWMKDWTHGWILPVFSDEPCVHSVFSGARAVKFFILQQRLVVLTPSKLYLINRNLNLQQNRAHLSWASAQYSFQRKKTCRISLTFRTQWLNVN